MGWSLGFDSKWNRDIGYGVPCKCDHPGCEEIINRGLSYVCCKSSPYGGDEGCGLYFCYKHVNHEHKCERCQKDLEPFDATGDILEWVEWKLKHKSWGVWRKENPEEVKKLKVALKGLKGVKDGK